MEYGPRAHFPVLPAESGKCGAAVYFPVTVVSLLVHADAAVLAGGTVSGATVLVEDGVVTAVGDETAQADRTVRARGTLLPGPIDLQVNGAGGRGVDEADPEALDAIAAQVASGGACAFLPTLITAAFERLLEQTARVAEWIGSRTAQGATPLGIHLEGPFLEVAGAHDASCFVDPTAQRVDALIEAARGQLRLVTLAPGRAGPTLLPCTCSTGKPAGSTSIHLPTAAITRVGSATRSS